MEKTDEKLQIELTEEKQNEDGTWTLTFEMSDETEKVLFAAGLQLFITNELEKKGENKVVVLPYSGEQREGMKTIDISDEISEFVIGYFIESALRTFVEEYDKNHPDQPTGNGS